MSEETEKGFTPIQSPNGEEIDKRHNSGNQGEIGETRGHLIGSEGGEETDGTARDDNEKFLYVGDRGEVEGKGKTVDAEGEGGDGGFHQSCGKNVTSFMDEHRKDEHERGLYPMKEGEGEKQAYKGETQAK